MPQYTYECKECGEFTLRQSMKEQHDMAECPQCHHDAKRVFSTFQTYKMDGKLKQRIERGQTPRIMSKDQSPKMTPRPTKQSRPWMADH
ncbi:FmdB family zinc ribbon protein [Staphylococcus warneri]|uniref:FmdB family zinc ribbon protein n=2 Tax=Staphylococcus warneri TaxID=1292 RepID=UPI000D1D1B10|nr:zinc ribbon domain-containing protein [Staphylococcus warneri]PTI07778.1 transcriptional regulator [Staphylococcus warneri]